MKHDLLVLLLLFFGVSGIILSSGVCEKQSKHKFPKLAVDRSLNLSCYRILSAFTKRYYFSSGNEVIFNTENGLLVGLNLSLVRFSQETYNIKQLFMKY